MNKKNGKKGSFFNFCLRGVSFYIVPYLFKILCFSHKISSLLHPIFLWLIKKREPLESERRENF